MAVANAVREPSATWHQLRSAVELLLEWVPLAYVSVLPAACFLRAACGPPGAMARDVEEGVGPGGRLGERVRRRSLLAVKASVRLASAAPLEA